MLIKLNGTLILAILMISFVKTEPAKFESPDVSAAFCTTYRCKHAIWLAVQGSATSRRQSDPLGSFQSHADVFDVNEVSKKNVVIRELPKCKKRIRTKYFTTLDRYM